MKHGTLRRAAGWGVLTLLSSATVALADPGGWVRRPVRLNIGPGLYGSAISMPEDAAFSSGGRSMGLRAVRPVPIAGFVPHIPVGLTNARQIGEFFYAHQLASSLTGTALNPPMSANYAIGVLDTGSTMQVIGTCDRDILGVNAYMTGNTIPIGGAGGQVDADVSWPLGFFIAGTQAIDPATETLNTAAMRGHWQVSVAALPDTCGIGPTVSTLVGTPLIAFEDVVIRNDTVVTIPTVGAGGPVARYFGPRVDILPDGSPSTPNYPKDVFLDLQPVGLTTSAYYPDLLNLDFETPWIPTALAEYESAIPTGGWFFASVRLTEGSSGELQKLFMMDTGAQVSVVRTFVAGQLGLDLDNPDFTIEVQGVSGDVTIAKGFYLDTFKVDASGGPMVFSNVPIVVLDVTSIDGGTLDGIVGTNVFYDRNLALKPGVPVLEVSNPIVNPVPGDYDGDLDVDQTDIAAMSECLQGPGVQPDPYFPCVNAFDFDGDGDVDLPDFGAFQRAL